MPICPHCNLGIPPTFVVCPDCGRQLVEVAPDDSLEEATEVGPAEVDEPLAVVEEAPENDVHAAQDTLIEEPADVGNPTEDDELPEVESVPEEQDLEEELPEVEDHAEEAEELPEEDEDVEEEDEVEEDVEVEDLSEEELPEEDEEEEEEDEDPEELEDLQEEQFIATGSSFSRLDGLDTSADHSSSQGGTVHRGKPVRWVHRAYRGDVEVINTKSSGVVTTLAVFGDGLLFIDSSRLSSGLMGATGGLVPRLSGGSARKHRRVLDRAGSSAEAELLLKGSRRLAAADIDGVRIDKGRARARELTIRTTSFEVLQFRFPSKRHRELVRLLSPVLGAKLRDMGQADKAGRTG